MAPGPESSKWRDDLDRCKRDQRVVNKELSDRLVVVEMYKASHEAEIQAWWHAQWQWNSEMQQKLGEVVGQVNKTSGRVIWLCGFAAAIGALLGGGGSGLLKALFAGSG